MEDEKGVVLLDLPDDFKNVACVVGPRKSTLNSSKSSYLSKEISGRLPAAFDPVGKVWALGADGGV